MECADRQASAQEEVISDSHNTSTPPEEEFWIDNHFQQMLKTLVRKFVKAENELYALKERIKRLKDSKREGKVPTGLVVYCVNAKGCNSQLLQERFDAILRDAELKLLDPLLRPLPKMNNSTKRDALMKKESRSYNRCLEEFISSQQSLSRRRRRSFCQFSKILCECLLLPVYGDKDL